LGIRFGQGGLGFKEVWCSVAYMITLRYQFTRELVLRGMAPKTQEAYIRVIYGLAKHYHQPPDQLGEEQLKEYLYYLAQERELSASSLNVAVSGMRAFYDWVLHRDCAELWRAMPRVRKSVRRPQVWDVSEVEKLITVGCRHPKHRVFLMTIYGAGLRLGEACRLEPRHIDSARMQIRVEQGKGRKDRYTLLSSRLLEELRAYWRLCRPGRWLFPASRDASQPMDENMGQKIYYAAVKRAGLPNKGGIHCLRHSFATHLLESGVEITIVQRLLGHNALCVTANYLHVRRERLAQIQSPLQLLDLDGVKKAVQS
jgi:integrase/recombinase XerD